MKRVANELSQIIYIVNLINNDQIIMYGIPNNYRHAARQSQHLYARRHGPCD